MSGCVLALISVVASSLYPASAPADPPAVLLLGSDVVYSSASRSDTIAQLRVPPRSWRAIWQYPGQLQAQPARKSARKDSLLNGALIGAAIGAALGIFTSRVADCPGDAPTGPCPGARAAGFLMATATGALIGVGIDALFDEQVTVPGLAAPGRARLQSRRRAGVRVAVRW